MGSLDPNLPPLPRLEMATLEGTRFDRTLERIPVVGWIWVDLRWKSRANPIVREIHTLLANRSIETVSFCDDDPSLRETAAAMAQIASDEIGWPNDRFLPHDPLATVLWAHEDGLDDTAALLAMEARFDIELPFPWVESRWAGTWGDFVKDVHRKRSEMHPPAPDTP